MEEWFTALTLFEKIYWAVALIASVLLVILLVLTLLGGDADDFDTGDVDMDIDGDTGIGFQLLSFKNPMGFLTIFDWSGIACLDAGFSKEFTAFRITHIPRWTRGVFCVSKPKTDNYHVLPYSEFVYSHLY